MIDKKYVVIFFMLFSIRCEVDNSKDNEQTKGPVLIVYESDSNIFVTDIDNNIHNALTDSKTNDSHPVVSPLGNELIYMSSTNSSSNLIRINIDGSGSNVLVSNAWNFSFSPNGLEIIYTYTNNIYSVEIQNKEIRTIAEDHNNYYEPNYSPDMTEIVCLSQSGTNYLWNVGKMNYDGLDKEILVDSLLHVSHPTFSPSGDEIMFVEQSGIFIMNSDGTSLTNLTNHYESDWAPTFTPDGHSIIYETNIDGNKEIYSVDIGGNNNTNLTNNTSNDISPSINSDGTKVLFVSDRDGDKEVFIMNIDGTEQTQVTENTVDDNTPHFIN